jgi:hypothetical protein
MAQSQKSYAIGILECRFHFHGGSYILEDASAPVAMVQTLAADRHLHLTNNTCDSLA